LTEPNASRSFDQICADWTPAVDQCNAQSALTVRAAEAQIDQADIAILIGKLLEMISRTGSVPFGRPPHQSEGDLFLILGIGCRMMR
jgi:hypothetical protein